MNTTTHQEDYRERVRRDSLEPGWALYRPSVARIVFNIVTDFIVFALLAGFAGLFFFVGDDEDSSTIVFIAFFGVFAAIFLIPLVSSVLYLVRRSSCFVLMTHDDVVVSQPRRVSVIGYNEIESIKRVLRRRHGVWPQTVIEIETAARGNRLEISSRYYAKIGNIHATLQQVSK